MNSSNSLWIALLIVWIAGAAWWHVCRVKLLCSNEAEVFTTEPVSLAPSLYLADEASLVLSSSENFSFAKSAQNANFAKIQSEIDSVRGYLREFPERRLVLTGLYAADEVNATPWANLGVARAEDLKAYYTAKGIAPATILTKGRQSDDLVFVGDSLYGGIEFQFLDALTLTENNLAEAQKFEGIFKSLDLYFNTGSTDFIPTADNQRFVEEARLFLSQNQEKKLLLTGHTDNTGDAAGNLALSQDRAESVKEALIASGIAAEQIAVDAKGQTQPKKPNDTPEGQAANRRVAIVVLN